MAVLQEPLLRGERQLLVLTRLSVVAWNHNPRPRRLSLPEGRLCLRPGQAPSPESKGPALTGCQPRYRAAHPQERLPHTAHPCAVGDRVTRVVRGQPLSQDGGQGSARAVTMALS